MNFNMNMRKILLTSAIAFSAASAFAADNQAEVVTQQKSLLEKLDSLSAAVLGLKINGTAKAGALASFSSSDQYTAESPTQENQAFTDVNLRLTARPSSETMVDVQLRLHKDWQSAYDENNNPVIGHWFSYDGTILNKHVDFNLGYMRVGYTPFTIYTPQTEILQEPEIFVEKRREALEKRNLDTTSRRLLQGLNVAYQSGSVGPVDNITAQLTGARLRNTAKKLDQVFFDFDFSDRYLLGGRVGADAYGAHLGVNYVNLLDRKLTRRSRPIQASDTVYYDNNMVLYSYKLVSGDVNGKSVVYLQDYYVSITSKSLLVNEEYRDEDGKSIYADVFVKGDIQDVDFKVNAGYLQTDSNFWSELASSPVYQGRSTILNANALYAEGSYESMIMSTFGASSLENLYFNVYNSTTLQATNLMTSQSKNIFTDNDESEYLFGRLNNNYKNGHFYRNGYTGNTAKKLELDPLMVLDPSVGLALPFGLATPNRKGIMAKADVNWADKVFFNARVNMLTQSDAPIDVAATGNPEMPYTLVYGENKFTEIGVGVGVDVGGFLPNYQQILLQGSFTQAKEDAYMKRTATRIVAGITADVWGPVALLAGFQKYEKKFDNTVFSLAVTKASEQLILGGVRVKLAPMSYLSVQYGMLKNDLDYVVANDPVVKQISISKNVLLADVTVNF